MQFAYSARQVFVAQQVIIILIEVARERQTIAYSELARRLEDRGIRNFTARNLGGVLDAVRDICLTTRIADLASIVVSKTTGEPGEGYTTHTPYWRQVQEHVFSYDWRSLQGGFKASLTVDFQVAQAA